MNREKKQEKSIKEILKIQNEEDTFIKNMKRFEEDNPIKIPYKENLNNIMIKSEERSKLIKNIENEFEHEENLGELKMEFSQNIVKSNMDNNIILRNPKKDLFNNNNKNKTNDKEENLFKPRQDDFNYLKINIKNNENDDINKALNNFIKKLKIKIKQKYEQIDIKISFKGEKEKSFNIYYQIEPMNINFDDIEFLDDDFEDKIKNPQHFEINVELIEGDKTMLLTNKINEYYLIFNGISVDKEDFYGHLNIIKEIAKNLFSI